MNVEVLDGLVVGQRLVLGVANWLRMPRACLVPCSFPWCRVIVTGRNSLDAPDRASRAGTGDHSSVPVSAASASSCASISASSPRTIPSAMQVNSGVKRAVREATRVPPASRTASPQRGAPPRDARSPAQAPSYHRAIRRERGAPLPMSTVQRRCPRSPRRVRHPGSARPYTRGRTPRPTLPPAAVAGAQVGRLRRQPRRRRRTRSDRRGTTSTTACVPSAAAGLRGLPVGAVAFTGHLHGLVHHQGRRADRR